MPLAPRLAGAADTATIGRLLHDFNREYEEPNTPEPAWLAQRLGELIEAGDTDVLLTAEGPFGLAVLRYQPSLWTAGLECYLAELYVVPTRRGQGLGRALMEAAIVRARKRGADYILLGTSEGDVAARGLYESVGFINRERPPDGPITFFYELVL